MTTPPLWSRAIGILVINEGVIIHGYIEDVDRTVITLAPGDEVIGAIVRHPETGRWHYDDAMRSVLGITEQPDFDTDGEAGRDLEDYLPPVEQLHHMLQQRKQVRDRQN